MEAKTKLASKNQLLLGDICERRQIKHMHNKLNDITLLSSLILCLLLQGFSAAVSPQALCS